MIEKSTKQKKGIVSEEDISTLLQRYTANTVLTLLQEVAQFEGVKIDWNALVKTTTTGISNAREYQMLWRHLAYRHALLENFEHGAQPLDDDSDLEYELQAFPDVSSEASTEAAACVKVLIASGSPSDSTHPNSTTVEAPLTINIPNGQAVRATSENLQPATMRGMNITVPVSVQKQPLPAATSTEGLDANGSASGTIPPRRKRKPWLESEDMELIAAVQKYGEGNWANILRSEFKWDRTASQLSQRWAIIRKRRLGNWNLGGNTSGVQLTEAQRAARHAMNLALDPPVKSTFTNNSGETSSSQPSSQRPFVTKSSSMGPLGSAANSQVAVNKLVKPDLNSNPVRAAAVAAGARVATQSDAASLLKAAQAKNAVHIMQASSSSIPSMPGGASSHSEARLDVHLNDQAAASVSTHPAVSTSGPCVALEKAPSPTTEPTPNSNAELSSKQDAETTEETKILSEDVTKVQVQEHQGIVLGNVPREQVQEEKAALPNQGAELKTEVGVAQSTDVSRKVNMVDVHGNQAEGIQKSNVDKVPSLSSVGKDENQSPVQENGDNKSTSNKQVDLPRVATDECSEKLEAVCKAEPCNMMTDGQG
ncbi:uncharacterized protein LOC110606592 isoform X2 [Manihot esculenta]|uniref:Uncharacterized protein n=2 Tax=Manihot esculenta TaxID=3983 RepID=A0A2C9U1N0_MANES|nr:uncharacterized protein LOC110606592 isoform X2 [Manihot esculenta]OAY23182.1 hypothetical protein MANES_18G058300v8 [Manihot esculenta]